LNFHCVLCFGTLLILLLTSASIDNVLHSLFFVHVISTTFLQLSAFLLIDHSWPRHNSSG
jgi:hypothetical protein